MPAPPRPFVALATIAIVEGVVFLAYGVFDLVDALRIGVTGPGEVSNVPAIALQIVLFVVFGGGLLWIATGLWRIRRWARSPFLLAQLIGVFIGFELAQSAGSVERWAGVSLCLLAALGIVLVFTPPVMRAFE